MNPNRPPTQNQRQKKMLYFLGRYRRIGTVLQGLYCTELEQFGTKRYSIEWFVLGGGALPVWPEVIF